MKISRIIMMFAILLILAPVAQAEKINIGIVDYTIIMDKYEGFADSFDKAFIGLPKGFLGLQEPFYGTLDEALTKFPALKTTEEQRVTILYMQGSGKFSKGPTFREWITGEAGYIFFAPNTHTGKDRPTYSSPVPKSHYEAVHDYRQAEISQFIARIDELPFIDKNRMFLMGNSEGAFAAARYAGKEFVARIALSWSCEPGYYTDYPKVGASYKMDPFLNIMGRDDAYFGKDNPWNNQYDNEGHCGDALFRFNNAKVVLLPKTGHNVMANQFTRDEVLSFIEMFQDHRTNPKE